MSQEQEYVLGTHEDELRRLGFQHQAWAEHTARLWDHAQFASGDHLLDLGCGPGYATADLAQLVGEAGSIVAVDMSRRFLSSLESLISARGLHNVHWQQSDAATLDVPSASMDGAFARWVLCFTPDPLAVVTEVARVLKPGARFAILDYANYEAFTMAPASTEVEKVIAATGESVRMHGGDFSVGLILPTLLRSAGFEVERIEPVVRIARPGTALWNWPESFFSNYLSTLVDLGLISNSERSDFETVWRERSANADAYLITPTLVSVVGVRR